MFLLTLLLHPGFNFTFTLLHALTIFLKCNSTFLHHNNNHMLLICYCRSLRGNLMLLTDSYIFWIKTIQCLKIENEKNQSSCFPVVYLAVWKHTQRWACNRWLQAQSAASELLPPCFCRNMQHSSQPCGFPSPRVNVNSDHVWLHFTATYYPITRVTTVWPR